MGQFADLKALLKANADKEIARGQAAYLRNQFKFYGIKTPQRRSLTRNLIKAAKRAAKVEWDFLDQCWLAEQREYQYFVCDYLKAMQGQLVYADLKRLELYVQTKQWWDTIDALDTIIGQIGLRDGRIDQLMLDWSQASDFWLRRIAIDHQRGRKEKTKQELLAKIIDNNLNREEFFINKAIGWALRDYSKTNPPWVKEFLASRKNGLAKLSLREASKYLR